MQKEKAVNKKTVAKKAAKKNFQPLTEEEMIFGFGKKPTDEQLEEFFSRPDGKGDTGDVVRKRVLARLKEFRES
jgi:hypothetical protein